MPAMSCPRAIPSKKPQNTEMSQRKKRVSEAMDLHQSTVHPLSASERENTEDCNEPDGKEIAKIRENNPVSFKSFFSFSAFEREVRVISATLAPPEAFGRRRSRRLGGRQRSWLGSKLRSRGIHTALSMFASRKRIQPPSGYLRKTDNVGPARRRAGPP
jgi:hypothetical protein